MYWIPGDATVIMPLGSLPDTAPMAEGMLIWNELTVGWATENVWLTDNVLPSMYVTSARDRLVSRHGVPVPGSRVLMTAAQGIRNRALESCRLAQSGCIRLAALGAGYRPSHGLNDIQIIRFNGGIPESADTVPAAAGLYLRRVKFASSPPPDSMA